MSMESREDLKSILPYLPLVVRSSTLFWPSHVVEALKAMATGPHHSQVDSGELLFIAISDIRHSLSLSNHLFAPSSPQGYSLFFDQLMSREESTKWFEEVVPALANLLLRFPSLLQTHYQTADALINGVKTGLRLLHSQEPGIVFLSQELIGALLGCSLFCLFPDTNRGVEHLPTINFDHLFANLYDSYNEKQENKIRCIIHYFERIFSHMPIGFVSFERKVLPLDHSPQCISYPKAEFWSNSVIPLCCFEVAMNRCIKQSYL
jgi:poly(ADP-ribose) glycohydrolase